MVYQFGFMSTSASSTTQIDNQTHAYNNRSYSNANDNYNDLTINLISSLSDKRKNEASGLGRDYWLDDSSAIKCRSCERSFTTFRRKHHCRICGKIFCSNCTTFIDGMKFNHNGQMRVCLLCLKLADRYEEYNSSEDESVIDDTSSSFHIKDSSSPARQELEPIYTNGEPSLTTGSAPTPPPMMAIATTRKGEAVEIDIPRSNSLSRKSRSLFSNRNFQAASIDQNGRTNATPSGNFNALPNATSNSNNNTNNYDVDSKKMLTPLNFTAAAANAAANAASSIFNFGTTPLMLAENISSHFNNNHNHSSKNNSNNSSPHNHNHSNSQSSLNPVINHSSRRSTGVLHTHHSYTDQSRYGNNEKPGDGHDFQIPLMFKSDSNLLTHSNMTRSTDFEEDYSPLSASRGQMSRSHTLLSDPTEESDESEDEHAMPAFTSLNPDHLGSNQKFNWSSRYPTNKSNNEVVKFDESSINQSGRRNFTSNRTRRVKNFHRLKNRRLSKSGSRILSESGTNNAFGRSTSSSNFGFGSEDFEFLDDFLRAGEAHSKQLLSQLLSDRKIDNIDEWIKTLIKCLKKISSISIDLSKGESFDISTYLKIKKIPGSSIEDSTVVDGMAFSRSLPLKTMPTSIDNPKIMIIAFQLEYEQDTDSKFSSLEPIIAQQDEYLKKLVGRIVALKPDIVLANSTVNGYALKLLADAGIAVSYSIKFRVLEKLARLTKADIINSIDKLAMNPMLGRCGKFELKTYLCDNVKRSYFFFTGCNPELGFTIVLRGSNKEILDKVKECATLMMYAFLNVKFESGLMRDQCLQASEYIPRVIKPLYNTPTIGSPDEAWEFLDCRILSSSPWVRFDYPFILSKLKILEGATAGNEELFGEFEQFFNRLKEEEKVAGPNEKKQLMKPEMFSKFISYWGIKYEISELPKKFNDLYELIKSVKEFKDEYYKSEILIVSRQWEQFWSSRKFGFFDPNFHQNIVTLFSMVSTKNATPCIGPDIQVTDFYWENDFCLGQFIEHMCLHANDMCTEGCGLVLKEHFRSYVHGKGKVDVVVENNPQFLQGKENNIMTWSYCKICSNSTAVLPLSENAWKYSFGKYLELSFWCRGMKVKGATCVHDFYEDQIHYFSFQNLTVRMEYSSIEILNLVPPKFQLFWKPEYDMQIKIDTFNSVLKKASLFFDSVRDRLNRVKVDSMTIDKMESGQKRIAELKKRVEKEHNDMKSLAYHIYETTSVSDHLKLTSVVREVQDLSSDWNLEFEEFDKNFLPTEKEIKKITTFQLDRLFKASTDHKTDEIDSISAKDEKEKKDEDIDEISVDDETEEDQQQAVNDLSDDRMVISQDQLSPNSRRKGKLVLDKINELQQTRAPTTQTRAISPTRYGFFPNSTLSDDKKLLWDSRNEELQNHLLYAHDNALPKLAEISNGGKVKKLTEFFDAQEFFREREKEKKKLEETRFRPKVVVSRPTVEVYKNVRDAVESEQDLPKRRETEHLTDETDHGNRKHFFSQGQAARQYLPSHLNETRDISSEPEDSVNHQAGSDVNNPHVSNKKSQEPESEPEPEPEAKKITQPEKTSLLKSLTHFWADRSSTLWEPLTYPLNSTEHIFVDSDVIVREDEPSSIIAFCLNTSDYSSKLYSQPKSNPADRQQQQQQQQQEQPVAPSTTTGQNSEEGPGKLSTDMTEATNHETELSISTSAIEDDAHKNSSNEKSESTNESSNLEQIMLKKGFHLKYQFEEGYSTISCKIFFAEQFDAFRRQCGANLNFIKSLSRCVKWDSTGGKSGSAFLKTLDSRFIIKELSRAELEAFVQFAPSYFEYFAQALFHNLPTVLVKIFGFYQIQVKNSIPGMKSYTLDVLIMENLFYDRKMTRIFDLKGSMRNRHVEQTGKENEVLLDENMVEYIYESPLFVRENAKRLLRASLWNDTLFLAKMNVMDYSLVVGIDSESSELVVGIIDCIRTFTWDKKLESWVKEKGLVGGTGVGREPTVITPKQYKNRFREAMERYILMAPGPFYQSL